MNYFINVKPDWIQIILQLVSILFLIGLIASFFYLVFKLPKSLKRISLIENKVNKIEEILKRIEDNMSE